MSIIAKYKFDSSIYADLIPEFNSEFTSDLYTITDEVDSENSNYIIRTIESDSLPTLMRFGRAWVDGETDTDNRTDSLLEVLDMNTSGLTSCDSMFRYCNKLTTLDLSNFDTSNVTTMNGMFNNCKNLTSLDVSNFDTSNVTDTTSMFTNTPRLADIGVLYCDQSTINKIASLLPTDIIQTIWVEDVDIKDLTPVEGIEFKQYAKNTEVMLTSPLLEGDKIEVIDGKLYHYHKMGIRAYEEGDLDLYMTDLVNTVYELASPYYELISDEPLNIPIVSETVDITNSSNIPINMIVDNSPLSTIAMNTSIEYTIAFDKSEDTSVVVDLCGSSIETTDNVVHITTPSELIGNELTIYGNGEEISNVRLLEGSVSGDSIPRESFEGLKSSFEDNLVTDEADENYGKYKVEYKVTNEDSTKEYTKTFYLNSPLLEGDTIEDVNGVATHVKRYEKVVLDGSENWTLDTSDGVTLNDNYTTFKSYHIYSSLRVNARLISDKFLFVSYDAGFRQNGVLEAISNGGGYKQLNIRIANNKLPSTDVNGFKQWLQANPTTVVYELASPIYEPISTESILCDSYVNGHLDVDSTVPIEKVKFVNWYQGLTYTIPSTKYKVQFESDNVGEAQVILAGSTTNINVVKGVNIVGLTSLATYPHNNLNIVGIGFNASNIQVVATDRDVDFGYFKGLQSSFESELVTDEVDEDYGKYEIECTVTNEDNSEMYTKTIYLNSPLLKGDTIEVHNGKLCHYHKMGIKTYEEGDLDLYITDLVNTVYELAEPYYEEIEPTQEDLIITSVKEGDLHIDTIVPISSKVTYNVNVQLLTDFEQSIVEQVQATQTTDLQSILDEEIDN